MRSDSAGLFIGVDGGGSRCRVRLCDGRGGRIGSAEGGPANVSIDFDRALATIHETIAAACRDAGLPEAAKTRSSIGLGLAGAASPAVAARVAAALPGFAAVTVRNDGVIACLGAHAGQDGGLVIAGTGSVAVLHRGGTTTTFGGRGFLLGDDGSGAVIGRALWRKALRALDGLEAETPLLTTTLRSFGRDPAAIIAWAREAPSHAFARHAPDVFSAAIAGDAAARAIASEAAAAIGELIEELDRRGAPRIALAGGLAEVMQMWLPPEPAERLSPPIDDALEGALLLAGAPAEQP